MQKAPEPITVAPKVFLELFLVTGEFAEQHQAGIAELRMTEAMLVGAQGRGQHEGLVSKRKARALRRHCG